MPDNYIDLGSQTSGDGEFAQEAATRSYILGRWAHFPAILVFGILLIAMSGHPWRWYVAIDGAYTFYVFGFSIGSVVNDMDDFFGNPWLQRCAAKLLIPHIPVLAVLTYAVYLWFHLNTILPSWVTNKGHKESLWDLSAWILLACAGRAEGIWMSGKFKLQLEESEE